MPREQPLPSHGIYGTRFSEDSVFGQGLFGAHKVITNSTYPNFFDLSGPPNHFSTTSTESDRRSGFSETRIVGDRRIQLQIGDRVFGITAGGAQAEYVVVPQSNLARVPAQLSWEEAGAMPEVFITAHDALFIRAGLQMGERVLVHAVASGVGTAAVQLAHAAGATVYGTSRSADKLKRMRDLKLGLKESIAVPDAPAKFVEAVHTWTNGAGVDVVVDLVGGTYFPASVEALSPCGRIICIGTTAGANSEIDLGLVMRKRAAIIGTMLRARSIEEKADAIRRFASAVLPLVSHGKVRPVIDRVYPVDQVHDAHERMESNASFGKIVLTFA